MVSFLECEVASEWEDYGHYKLEFSVPPEAKTLPSFFSFEVAGTHHVKQQAQSFIRGSPVGVQLKRERFNLHDRNAIRVIGVTRDGAQHALGYIPKEISKRIAKANLFDSIKPVLCLTKISASGFTLIIVSLYGPEGTYEKLEDPDALAAVQEREARANANAKEYLRHKQSEATRRSPLAGARLLEIKKRYREAAEIYSEFLLENSDTDVYDALSRCYLALGDVASVVSTLEEYLEVTNRLDETLDKTLLERLEHSYNTINTSS